MIRTGEVVERDGDMAAIVFERPTACGNCKGCAGNPCTRIELLVDADVGDTVDVEMPDKHVVAASALVYLIPLAFLLLGLLSAAPLHGALHLTIDINLLSAIMALLPLGIGLFVVARIDRSLRDKQDWQPRVLTVHKK